MDIVQLSAAIVAILAPFTPYLVEGGKKFAGHAGDAAWQKAQDLWSKLTVNLGDDAKIKGKVIALSADPEDRDEQSGLAKDLAVRLKENSQLAEELSRLIGGPEVVVHVLADRSSWVEDVIQEIEGSGSATVKASDNSVIKGVKQTIRK